MYHVNMWMDDAELHTRRATPPTPRTACRVLTVATARDKFVNHLLRMNPKQADRQARNPVSFLRYSKRDVEHNRKRFVD